MDAPFLEGVPYLSFEEESMARTTAAADWARDDLVDIGIKDNDTENLQLMRRVRLEIDAWMRRATVRPLLGLEIIS